MYTLGTEKVGNTTFTKLALPTHWPDTCTAYRVEHPPSGLDAVLAYWHHIHGVGIGGTRKWPYSSLGEQLNSALHLSQGMAHKLALANLPMDGFKAVINANKLKNWLQALEAHANALNHLANNGHVAYTGEDMRVTVDDIVHMSQFTGYIAGLKDPSIFTAQGLIRAMQAGWEYLHGTNSLKGVVVGIRGLGHVGRPLAKQLLEDHGAIIWGWDINQDRRNKARELGVKLYNNAMCKKGVDIASPCAAQFSITPPLPWEDAGEQDPDDSGE